MPTPTRPAPAKGKHKARTYTTSELARSLAVQREYLLALCESGLIEARPNGQGDYIVGEREKERVVREGLPELPASTDREGQAELIAPRRVNPSSPASSVLAAKREEVEVQKLDLESRKIAREVSKFDEQDAEAERAKKEARRTETLANKATLAQTNLEQQRDRDREAQAKRDEQAQKCQADFERRWKNSATAQLPDWLTFEQQEIVSCAIDSTVRTHGPDDEQIIESTLRNVIRRLCAPWAAERQARAKRDQLVEETVRRLLSGATDAEKARAAGDARAALALLPLTASELEIQSAVSAAVNPIARAIENRKAKEKQREDEARQADNRKRRKDDLVRAGVYHVALYLVKLYLAGKLPDELNSDYEWRSALKDAVRDTLEEELTGAETETRADAEAIAERVVDEELEEE